MKYYNSTELQEYQTALNVFQAKYFALPGDMPNATQFWGRADGSGTSGQCANPETNSDEGTTCNGDGDGILADWIFGGGGNEPERNEMFRAWEHLSLAGLITGTYSGISGSATNYHHEIGENCPRSSVSGAGWSIFERGETLAPWYDTGIRRTVMVFGGESATWETNMPVLLPEEAWNIDTKMDDGRPGLGSVITQNPSTSVATNCASDVDETVAEYQLSFDSAACI